MTNWFKHRFIKSRSQHRDNAPLARRFWLAKAGSIAVEFALIAPIFLILVTGIIEVGRLMFIRSTLQFAVDEAARFALVQVDPDLAVIQTLVGDRVMGINVADITFTITSTIDASAGSTKFTLVNATYDFTPIVAMLPFGTTTLTARARVPQTLDGTMTPDGV